MKKRVLVVALLVLLAVASAFAGGAKEEGIRKGIRC